MSEDVFSMMALATISVVLFCACSFFLISSLRKPVPIFNTTSYSRSALRVRKAYEVFAWSTMSVTFLLGLVMSFIDVYRQI